MNQNLSLIEYEGLEYVLLRIVQAVSNAGLIPHEEPLFIHQITERTATGIRFCYGSDCELPVYDFTLKGVWLQDGTCILIAFHIKNADPVYIEMTDFINSREFDLDTLLWKLNQNSWEF